MRFVLVLYLLLATHAHANYSEFAALPHDSALETKLRAAADATLQAYPKLKADDLAITLVDVGTLKRADYHGETPMYPASVIKLFFMADVYATHKEKIG